MQTFSVTTENQWVSSWRLTRRRACSRRSDTVPDVTVNGDVDRWVAGHWDRRAESGSGVMDRLTIASTEAAVNGLYTLTMQFPVTIDTMAGAFFPHNVDADSDGDSGLDTVSERWPDRGRPGLPAAGGGPRDAVGGNTWCHVARTGEYRPALHR